MGTTSEAVADSPGHRTRWRPRGWWAVAAGYPLSLVSAGVLLALAAPRARADWLAWASTSVANLARHPLGSLVASAFLSTGDPLGFALLGLIGLTVLGRRFGAWRSAVLVLAAHTIGTLVSEGIQAVRLGAGAVPPAGAHLMDVGPSYVVVAALAAGLAYGGGYGRLVCGAGLGIVAPTLFGGLFGLDVTAVGHLTSIFAGLLLGRLLRPRRQGGPDGSAGRAPAAGTPVGTPAGTPIGTPIGTPAGTPIGTPIGTPAGTPAGTPVGR